MPSDGPRGQDKHADFWWNLPRDNMVRSGWGQPLQFGNGIAAEDLLANRHGHSNHFRTLRERRNVQTFVLGETHQLALEVRPAHDPAKGSGFVGVLPDMTNLQRAIFTCWRKDEGTCEAGKTITIDPQSADAADLPDLPEGFGAVLPLVTDIDLRLDDRFLHVSCRSTGEILQYDQHDVSDPMAPKLAGKVRIGGIVRKARHLTGKVFGYGPQMVEISRDGKRVRRTNALHPTRDDQFNPGEGGGAMVRGHLGETRGLMLDEQLLVTFPEDCRSHRIRLEGGDCSTDSFCYPSV